MERKNYKMSQKISKKIRNGIKWSIFYLEVSVNIVSRVIPSQVIGLTFSIATSTIIRSID